MMLSSRDDRADALRRRDDPSIKGVRKSRICQFLARALPRLAGRPLSTDHATMVDEPRVREPSC
jgi:hypothetical protein